MATRNRLSLSLADWPRQDQAAWRAARSRSDQLFAEDGRAAGWRPKTARQVEKGYGLFLGCLERHGCMNRDACPADRIAPENVALFRAELEARVASCTTASRLRDLKEAIRVMAPEADLTLLKRALSISSRKAVPSRRKRTEMIAPGTLFRAGLARMRRADAETHCKRDIPAGRYRDGLMIAFLAARPIVRIANLAAMRLGIHIERQVDVYVCRFSGEETKNGDPMQFELPADLTPAIDRYLNIHRPTLLRGHDGDAFWVSTYRGPMSEQTIRLRLKDATLEEVGVAIPPHRFRDCAATGVAEDDPTHVRIVPRLLGHRDERTATRHYNNAGALTASRRINAVLIALRDEALAQNGD